MNALTKLLTNRVIQQVLQLAGRRPADIQVKRLSREPVTEIQTLHSSVYQGSCQGCRSNPIASSKEFNRALRIIYWQPIRTAVTPTTHISPSPVPHRPIVQSGGRMSKTVTLGALHVALGDCNHPGMSKICSQMLCPELRCLFVPPETPQRLEESISAVLTLPHPEATSCKLIPMTLGLRR